MFDLKAAACVAAQFPLSILDQMSEKLIRKLIRHAFDVSDVCSVGLR